jgi:hypothetical protein
MVPDTDLQGAGFLRRLWLRRMPVPVLTSLRPIGHPQKLVEK